MGRRRLPNPHHYGVLKEVVETIHTSDWLQREIEKVSGTSQGFISQLSTGHIKKPGLPLVEAVLNTIGYELKVVRRRGPIPVPPRHKRRKYAGQETDK